MPAPKFYITTAIAYPNGAPHVGHAYEEIATDAIARFMRLDGHDVYFLTGTDEHGIKMKQTAAREGIEPLALADRNTALFREMVTALGVSNDDFIRTTEPRHHRASQEIWRRMKEAGDIYKDTYAGWYSIRDEAYYAESETEVRPDDVRYGPQGTPVEWVEEESYFFRLSAYQDRLLAFYEANPDFIGPDERRNEVTSFVRSGLRDLSISRTTFDWGIRVPDDPQHVMYVWVDALTNYITAVGFPDEGAVQHYWPDGPPLWRFWPADLHVIGKDILRFHAVYWPAFLWSAGLEPPKRVFAHGFVFNRGEKMSKSVGNVIDPFNLIKAYGRDPVRYFFLREVPFGQDGNYSHEAIVQRINADLANDLGNLAQRSLSMIARNCSGVLPEEGALTADDKQLLADTDALLHTARAAMKVQQIHQYLNAVWAVVADANRYFAAAAPWALRKTDPARMGTVLYVAAEVIRQVAILAQPAMPESAGKLLDLLGVGADGRDFATLGDNGRLKAGTKLPEPAPVFPRYVEAETKVEG
jgi:methionyl-tRNA synthetase